MKFKKLFSPYSVFALCLTANLPTTISAQIFTWDGGGADTNWSTDANWVGDAAPPATGAALIFDGTTGISNTNDSLISTLDLPDEPAITFGLDAGAFVLNGTEEVTVGTTANSILALQNSASEQEIAFPIQSLGGNRTRNITFGNGAARLSISGDYNGTNDRIAVNGSGVLALTGNNSGDGNPGGDFGTNSLRALIQNNATGLTFQVGSPTAFGNPSPSFELQHVVRVRQNLSIEALTDLTGANAVNNTFELDSNSNRVLFLIGTNDIEIGGLLAAFNGSHSIRANEEARLIIGGNGLMLASGQEAKSLQLVAGEVDSEIIINGPIHDTFHSEGITSTRTGLTGELIDSTIRVDGDGTLTINSDNSTTYHGETFINNGVVKLGNPNALGSTVDTPIRTQTLTATFDTTTGSDLITGDFDNSILVGDSIAGPGIDLDTTVVGITLNDAPLLDEITLSTAALADGSAIELTVTRDIFSGGIALRNDGSLDLNGLTVAERFIEISGSSTIINSNTNSPAELTVETVNLGNPTFNGPGDITVSNIRHTGGVSRRITKNGAGTLTLGGDLSNARYGLTVNEGNVVLAKTAGEAVARFALIINNAASTVTLTNTGEQIGDQTDVNGLQQINEGTLDLNGFDEGLGALSTTSGTEPGGIVTNSNAATTSTLTLLGAGTAATWPGTVSGNLNLVQNSAFDQTLTGTLTYTGDTTINAGTLALGADSDLPDSGAVFINGSGGLSVSAGNVDIVDQLTIDGVQQPSGTYGAVGSGATIEDSALFPGGGILSVTSDPAQSDFDLWAASFNLVGGPDDDDDNDGISNNEEYAFALNPTSSSSLNAISTVLEQATGTFSYTRRDPANSGLTYSVFTSTTLQSTDWNLDAAATQTVAATDANGNQTVAVTLSTGLTELRLFVRVEAN